MKKILTIMAAAVLLAACSENDTEQQGNSFRLEEQEVTLEACGGTELIQVQANGNWSATTSVPWVNVSPANGRGNATLQLTVDSTLVDKLRQTKVRFMTQTGEPVYLDVSQIGYGKNICPDKELVELEYSAKSDKRKFQVQVATNVPFRVEVETADGQTNWLTCDAFSVDLNRGSRPRTTTLTFNWKLNMDPAMREAKIRFVPTKADDQLQTPSEMTVRQKAAPKIEDNREGDSLAMVLMYERMNAMYELNASENMMYWDEVDLWEEGDKNLPCPEAVGRVRYASISLVETDETIAPEVAHLKYLDQLSVFGNVNTMFKNIELGSEVCSLKYLKRLQIAAYGLISLPEDFKELGKTLTYLNLSDNNFTDIPECINRENFPHLKQLIFNGNRRWTCLDLRLRDADEYTDGIGFFQVLTERGKSRVRDLFLWDTLEQLALTYNYLEGNVPDFEIGEEGVTGWTEEDVQAWGGDTIRNLVTKTVDGKRIPKILPKAKNLAINLNYFTGKLPNWLLYHPRLLNWIPESFIFTTQEGSMDSQGRVTGFTNVPETFDYYYDFFPGYREKYYIEEE